MGAIETAMIDAAYARLEILNFAHAGLSWRIRLKVVDAQAGMESGISTMIGAWRPLI